jgi:hypothetical protein
MRRSRKISKSAAARADRRRPASCRRESGNIARIVIRDQLAGIRVSEPFLTEAGQTTSFIVAKQIESGAAPHSLCLTSIVAPLIRMRPVRRLF